MNSTKYFDAHLHMREANNAGLDALLGMLDRAPGCLGGNLVLNTAPELDVVLRRLADIPPWLQLVPCLDLLDRFPEVQGCGWIKLHPTVQRLQRAHIATVLAQLQPLRPTLKGVMVHCFPWGNDLNFNCGLDLVSSLAQTLRDCWVLATHGGGYESWAYRAHVGAFKNVLFDFSASLAYYAGSDLLRPLQRYLTYSPDRVLFGTDWPSATCDEQWNEMMIWSRGAGLDEEQLESLLLDNSLRTWPGWKAR